MNWNEIKKQADKDWDEYLCRDSARVVVGGATCGRAAGANDVLKTFKNELRKRNMDREVKLFESGCMGMCHAEPVVEVKTKGGERLLYTAVDAELVPRLVEEHLGQDKPIRDLVTCVMGGESKNGWTRYEDLPMIKHQVKIVLRNAGIIDPANINHYIARGGYSGIVRAIGMTPEDVIEEMKNSGLRGRGGAGFPTGLKWSFARKSEADQKYVICNADEGDPGAFMDRSVLEGDPHAMLEGLMIAGYAIGASVGYVYCRAEYPLAIERLQIAISQMREKGLLGDEVLGSDFSFDIKIKKGAGAFVCGEETSLMASIEGHRGMPRSKPPFPAVSGLFGKPTNINNVETLAAVSAIMEKGAEWYGQFGTEKSKGTKTFALAGKIRNTGLIEVPMGIPLATIIFDIGGGIPQNKKYKAVQTGGPSGGCIPAEHLNMPIDYEHLAEVGSIMGSGGMIVIDEDSCMVDVARYFLGFTESESCGKCVPCRMGTQHLLRILTDITEGRGTMEMLDQLLAIGDTMKKGSLCGLGQTAPNPVVSTLRYFRHEYEAHIRDHACHAAVCSEMFRAPCQHACPVEMDVPSYIALVRANRLEEAYKVLKRTNPFPSVCGRVCNHRCESKCRRTPLDGPLAIKNLKRFITDEARPPKVEKVPVTRSEKIAVIGGGPSGLAAAQELKRRGYAVTVFEAQKEAGGMMRWGIPEYRLPRDVLAREIQDIVDAGVLLKTGVAVGKDVSFDDLKRDFDHIYVAAGAQKSMPMSLPGEDSEDVFGAIEFLRKINMGEEVKVGSKVAVIGGGNSAIDAARCALRTGAEKVTIFYRRERKDMPALPEEIEAAEHEGIEIVLLVGPTKVVVTAEGKVIGLELQRMELGDVDRSARKRPMPIEGSEYTVEVDTVISAIGQKTDLEFIPESAGVDIGRGRIAVDRGHRAGGGNVWAGGDVVTGPSVVVRAIRAGQDAARSIDAAIREGRGEDAWTPPESEFIDVPCVIDAEIKDMATTPMPEAGAAERIGDFREVEKGYTLEQAMEEATRCLRCDYRGE